MSWALIAGGSKGIGYYIAEALARRGYNLILVARNQEELATSKTKLENNLHIQVEILSYDLSLTTSAMEIASFCGNKSLALNILCNAAGMGGAKDYLKLPPDDLRNMVRVNIESPMSLTLALLPILQKNNPSYILNIGSIAGFAPIPSKNIYSATKSALIFFSYSLQYQLEEKNISVSCLCPGPIFTKPAIEEETVKKLGWLGKQMAVQPEVTGEIAVRNMLKRKLIIVPGKLATMISFILRMLPARLLACIFYQFGKKEMNHSAPE